jgi:hypothetical protein
MATAVVGDGSAMNTYIVTQDGARVEVRVGDANGRVLATFSNKLAADKFAEKQRTTDESAAIAQDDGDAGAGTR